MEIKILISIVMVANFYCLLSLGLGIGFWDLSVHASKEDYKKVGSNTGQVKFQARVTDNTNI